MVADGAPAATPAQPEMIVFRVDPFGPAPGIEMGVPAISAVQTAVPSVTVFAPCSAVTVVEMVALSVNWMTFAGGEKWIAPVPVGALESVTVPGPPGVPVNPVMLG